MMYIFRVLTFISILSAGVMAQEVTLNVDMNCTDTEFSTVYVNGPFTGWCGDCLPMTDADGDGVWSVTISDQPAGDLEYKYTLDGWTHQEDLIDDMVGGASCAPVTDNSSYANRVVTITTEGSSTDDSYGTCEACTIEPTGTPHVTFQVDTRYVDTETTGGVYLAGGNIPLPEGTDGWVGLPLSDDDGDGIFEVTVELEANTYYHYKFTNGLNTSWGGPYWENISSDCGDPANYNDRNFTTGDTDMTLPLVCFSSCEECEEVQVTSNVTFQVNMAGTEVSTDGVFLHGNWFGWGEIAMTDDDGDCMYEATVEVVAGIDGEYLFKNGGANEQVPAECDNINNWGGGINRLITMPDVDTTREPICFAACEGADCSGTCGEVTITPAQVTFQVDMSDNSDVTAVAVAGSFNSWGGADMSDDDGDGVYTLTVELNEGDYEYKFIGAGWSANEFEDYSFPITADAPDCIALANCDEAGDNCQYNNRFISVGSDDITVDEVCWASCEDCGGDPDPCADVTCGDGQSCVDGACVDDCSASGVVFSGEFGGTSQDCDMYTFPTGAEGWGGFANEDTDLYPYSFPDGGEITFTGAANGTDADVYFRFEYNPYPDTEPSFNTAAVTVSGASSSYSVDIPAQGANTFSSFLLYVTTADVTVTVTDVTVHIGDQVACGTGDVNDDGALNILDIVMIVSEIVGQTEFSADQICAADINDDGAMNVLDIVQFVEIILNNRGESATNVEIIKTDHAVHMNADGFVGAVQMTLNHSEDFELNLTNNAFVADYNTVGNSTTLMVVSPEGNELFTAHGAFTIESIVAASADSYLNTEISVPAEILIGNAYPNPFNPSTTLSVELNTETYVSMNVFNVMGQLVGVITEGNMNAGTHVITWDASQLSSGIYLVNTVVGNSMHQQKVMLLK